MGSVKVITTILILFSSMQLYSYYDAEKKVLEKVATDLESNKVKSSLIKKQLDVMGKEFSNKKFELEKQNKKITEVQAELELLKKSQEPIQKDLSKLQLKFEKELKSYILVNSDSERSTNELYQAKLIKESLKENLKKLSEKKKENTLLDERIKLSETMLSDFTAIRDSLVEIMNSFDFLKNKVAETIKKNPVIVPSSTKVAVAKPKVEKTDSKFQDEDSFFDKKLESTEVIPANDFLPPVNSFIQLNHEPKGIRFMVQDVASVKASSKGKVIFCGELASIGNVVMIDHGEEIRTVTVGDFIPLVKKDDAIEKSGIIGQIKISPNKKNSIYFEIRKKNLAQNAASWLGKSLHQRTN